jgi:predicted esterase
MREFLEKDDCVVRFARTHAAAYGGDPNDMVVFGHSAGAYGGLWVSLVSDEIEQIWNDYDSTQGEAEQQVSCLAEGSSENIDAFVGYGGAYAYFEVSLRPEEGEFLKVLSPSTYFGENPELIIRFIHGESDSIVPETAVQQHKAWIEELTNMGYDASWMEMVGGHGLDARTFDPVVEMIMEVAQR